MLSFDQIAAVNDRPTLTVPVPEWGGEVGIRTISAAGLLKLETEAYDDKGFPITDKYRALVVSLCVVGDGEKPLFDTPEKVEALKQKNGNVFIRLYDEAAAHNRLHKGDATKN